MWIYLHWQTTLVASYPGWIMWRRTTPMWTLWSWSAFSSLSSLTSSSSPSSWLTTTCENRWRTWNFFLQVVLDCIYQRVNFFMISICVSDASFALYMIVFLQPGYLPNCHSPPPWFDFILLFFPLSRFEFLFNQGINEGRYADFVNETSWTCKWSKVLAAYLMTAPWYNFLGECFVVNFHLWQYLKTINCFQG